MKAYGLPSLLAAATLLTDFWHPGLTQAQTPILWNGAGTDYQTGTNWSGGVAPTNDLITDAAVFGSTVLTNQPVLSANRSVGQLIFQSTTGGWTLGGSAFTLQVGVAGIDDTANTSGITTISANVQYNSNTVFSSGVGGHLQITGTTILNGQRTLTVNSGTVTLGDFNGQLANRTIQKLGAGTLVLSGSSVGANASTLGLQATGGTTVIANASALGANGLITLGSGTLQSTVENLTLSNAVSLNSSSAAFSGAQSITFTNAMTLLNNNGIFNNLDAGRTLTFAGDVNLANSGAGRTFTVNGGGNTVVSGNLNEDTMTTGSGALRQSGTGTTTLSGANTFTGSVTVNSGRLIFDYATNNQILLNANTNALVMNGGTAEFKGRTGAISTSQTLGNVTTGATTGLSTITLNSNGGNGTALTVGTLAPNATRSSLLIDLGDNANSFTTATDLSVVNVRALVRDGSGRIDYATNTGSNTAISALNAFTDLPANPNVAGTHYRLTGSQTLTGSSQTALSLRIDPSSAGQSLVLDHGTTNNNYRFNSILFAGSQDFTITLASGKGGSIGSAAATGTNGNALIYHYGTGKLTLDAKIGGGNNSASGTGAVEFYGTGLIEWTRSASSSGLFTIGGVTLRQNGSTGQLLTNAATGLGSGNIALSNSGVIEVSDATTITRDTGTASGQIQWLGDGGFSAFGGTRSVSLNSGGTLDWSATVGINALVLGSNFSNGTVDFQNALDLGSDTRTVRVNNGVSSTDVDARLSGVISGAGGLNKTGNGTLLLANGANAYSGTTTVSGGTLQVGSGGTGTTGTGAVVVQTASNILGTGLIQGSSFTAQSGSTVHVGDGSAEVDYGTLTFTPASGSGNFDFQSGSSVILGINPNGTGDRLSFDGLSAGTLTFNGNLIVVATGFTPVSEQTFQLLDWANITSLTFANRYNAGSYGGLLLGNGDDNLGFDLPDISTSGFGWDISTFTTAGTISTILIPEPSRTLLSLIGIIGILGCRRRK